MVYIEDRAYWKRKWEEKKEEAMDGNCHWSLNE